MKTEVRLLTALAGAMALSGCNWFDDDPTDLAPTAAIEFPDPYRLYAVLIAQSARHRR